MDILEQAYFLATFDLEPLPHGTTPTQLAELAIESLAGSRIHPIGMMEACREKILNDPRVKPEIRNLADEMLR
ncbi:MAG: hypothetical protein AAB394_00710 [Patescibacteria group bacterium]